MRLQERLDKILTERRAAETGMCAIREEIYAQCFDELVRQVTVETVERGLLLMRCRDELRVNVGVRNDVAESAIAYGMRMTLSAHRWMAEKRVRLESLQSSVNEVRAETERLRELCAATQKREDETTQALLLAQSRERERLFEENKLLKQDLEDFILRREKYEKRSCPWGPEHLIDTSRKYKDDL